MKICHNRNIVFGGWNIACILEKSGFVDSNIGKISQWKGHPSAYFFILHRERKVILLRLLFFTKGDDLCYNKSTLKWRFIG